MGESARIADQVRRAMEGDAFHGPAVLELLRDVTAEEASARPLPGAHTIWELCLHIGAWEAFVGRRLSGETIDEVPDVEDWPPPAEASPAAWDAIRQELLQGNRRLRDAIEAFGDARLREPVATRDYDYGFMLHGIVQHDLYHAGQIALLKKAARGTMKP